MSSVAALVELSGMRPHPASCDVQVTRAFVFGCRAWIAYRYDGPEKSRRAAFGLGSILSWDLLDTLMDLPAGLPVPTVSLTEPERRRVTQAPTGVARVLDGQVIRDLVPAVTPLLAIINTHDWVGGLVRASRFAPYCRRVVVGPGLFDGDILRTASRLGVGVAVRSEPRATELILEPDAVNDWQPTTAWWRFCEVIYGHASGTDG